MAYRYYYAPCFKGFVPDENGDPSTLEVKQPGKDIGAGTVYAPNMPIGTKPLKYDDPILRVVVRLAASTPPLAGWVEKTPAEVLVDYPGLPGVV